MQITSSQGVNYDFTIGADPEFFVKRNGKLLSAYGLVPGTKDRPFPVPSGAVQVDGMALEFNIDPAKTYHEFEHNMQTVLDSILRMIPGYEIFTAPVFNDQYAPPPASVADFGADYIASQPNEAKELGCNPDYNAYTKQANPRPNAEMPFRTASGHVHIGWTSGVDVNNESHLEACYALAKSLDVWLGIPSLLWDDDERRRSLYGAPGAFRPKPYGMEYRMLSNKWITNPLLRQTVYWNTVEAIKSTFADPKFGDNTFGSMTAKEIIEYPNKSRDDTKWTLALRNAFEVYGIRTPAYYRKQGAL